MALAAYFLKHVATQSYVVFDSNIAIKLTRDITAIDEYNHPVMAFNDAQKEVWKKLIQDHTNLKFAELAWEPWIQNPVRPLAKSFMRNYFKV